MQVKTADRAYAIELTRQELKAIADELDHEGEDMEPVFRLLRDNPMHIIFTIKAGN